jgi:hypothetical protein
MIRLWLSRERDVDDDLGLSRGADGPRAVFER